MESQKTDQKNEAVEIPENVIQDMKRVMKSEVDTDTGSAFDIIENKVQDQERIESLERLINMGAGAFDRIAKSQGLPGLAGVKPDEFAEVTKIWLEYEGFDRVVSESPRYMFGSLIVTIVGANAIEFQRLKKKAKSDE